MTDALEVSPHARKQRPSRTITGRRETKDFRFNVIQPIDRETLDLRIALNQARKLPEAAEVKTCIIVGSGPSALSEDTWDRIRNIKPGECTVACNGALKLFTDRGLYPHIWTCCDPQELVNDFLPEHPPEHTLYCLATKCPESLFERLSNRWVHVWRLDDMLHEPGKLHVPTAVSITLVTQSLMRFRGFHRFEMYGWDCCYLNDRHHASDQPDVAGQQPIEIQDAEGNILHSFQSIGSWSVELRDALLQTSLMKAMGYDVVVNGPGAVAALLRAHKLIA